MSSRSSRNEQRTSLSSQVGYLTGKVETIDVRIDNIDTFLREHMEKEEQINKGIYKYMGILTLLVLLQSAGLSLKQIFEILVALLT